MNLSEKNRNNVIFGYLLIVFILCIGFYLVGVLTNGEYLLSVFANASDDTFMDHFNSLNNAKFDPYKEKFSNYPAMACMIYKAFFTMIPGGLRGGTGLELRNVQPAIIIFIIYTIVLIWSIQIIIQEKSALEKNSKLLYSFIILLCAPIVFTIERGNIIFLSFVLSLFFTAFYDSKNRILKELSFVALAVSAAIKIYPAVFGMLIIKKKNICDLVRLIVYGIIAFIAPFFYYDGFESLKLMIKALIFTSNLTDEIGYGINISLYNILKTISIIFNFQVNDLGIYVIYAFVILVILISFWCLNEKWQEFLCISLLLIFLPKTNYYYAMIFMLIPIGEFLNEFIRKEKVEVLDGIVLIIFCVLLVPWSSNVIPFSANDKFFVSYTMLIYYLALLWLVMTLLHSLIKKVLKNRKNIGGVVILTATVLCSITTVIMAMIK